MIGGVSTGGTSVRFLMLRRYLGKSNSAPTSIDFDFAWEANHGKNQRLR